MSVKKYGIYLAYPPGVELQGEGLGRYLGEFLKAAQERDDIRFVIACPSWIYPVLSRFFRDFGIQPDAFDVLSPRSKPWLLRLYEGILWLRTRLSKRKRVRSGFRQRLNQLLAQFTTNLTRQLVGARSLLGLSCVIVAIALFIPFGMFALILSFLLFLLRRVGRKLSKPLDRFLKVPRRFVGKVITSPKNSFTISRLYELMTEAETSLIQELIKDQKDILAWYCPTAFWSHFNRIAAPRLICVPDVFPVHFPVSFARSGDDRRLHAVQAIEQTIREGNHFVTYSEEIKWETLVDRYQVAPEAVHIIPHGVNRMDHLVTVSGFSDNEASTDAYCRALLENALAKAVGIGSTASHLSSQFSFLFYASQIRPNKNLLSLLKSYEYLLRRCYLNHKLILTGNPYELPEVRKFVETHNLQYDVLFLHKLSLQELAACYRLADLAINPSLSEGGCPFTFTEALSVGTPVVMARIPVTEEIITDPTMQDLMLFNPYDWKDIVERINWAINHADELLAKQKVIYATLAQRTWETVVDEHIVLLDKISNFSARQKFNK